MGDREDPRHASMEGERRERFPAAEQLRGKDAFRRVYDKGEARRGQYMVLITLHVPESCVPHGQLGGRRVGFVSSRKVGNAVKRNRARRLLRECYRRLRPSFLPESADMNLVFVARYTLPGTTYENAFHEMRRLLAAAGVMHDGNHDVD